MPLTLDGIQQHPSSRIIIIVLSSSLPLDKNEEWVLFQFYFSLIYNSIMFPHIWMIADPNEIRKNQFAKPTSKN